MTAALPDITPQHARYLGDGGPTKPNPKPRRSPKGPGETVNFNTWEEAALGFLRAVFQWGTPTKELRDIASEMMRLRK